MWLDSDMTKTICPCGIRAAAHLCKDGTIVRDNTGLTHRAAQVVYEDARYFPYEED